MMDNKKDHFIMVMSGPEDGRVFEIHKDQVTIGRSDENDVIIRDDAFKKPAHALLVKRDAQFFLVSESSSDKRATVTLPINMGQIFTLGETEFVIKYK